MSNTNPLVSIVTPSFNSADYIEDTIKSVLNQSYKNIEFIIYDGGSTDGTVDIIKKYSDKIAFWVSEPDKGQTDAINKGFAKASGDLIGWLCADDLFYPDTVASIVGYINDNNLNTDDIGVIFGNTTYFDGEKDTFLTNGSKIDLNYIRTIKTQVIQPGSFHSKKVLRKIGPLNEQLNFCMDYDLWLRCMKENPSYFIDKPLSKFRVHNDSKSEKDKLDFAKELYKTNFKYNKNPFSPIKLRLIRRMARQVYNNVLGK